MARQKQRLSKSQKQTYLDEIAKGARRFEAARAIGVPRKVVWLHMKADRPFAEDVVDAEHEACEKVERALYDKAISGNVAACFGWLYSRWPERWRDMRGLPPTEAFLSSLPPEIADKLRKILRGLGP